MALTKVTSGVRTIATDEVVTASIADDAVTTSKIADDAVTLAKMAPGTGGNLISFDASGNPAAVATGSSGEVLTSQGAGAAPVFATVTVGRVLLVDTAISGSPSALSFEDSDGMNWSTYSSFEFELAAIISANMQINCTMSQAGVYETGGTDYTYTTSSSYTWSATGTNAAANIPIPNSSGQIYKGGAGYNEGFHMTARLSQRITDATDMQGPFLAWQMMGNITGTGNVAEQSGIGFLRNMVDSDIDGIKFTTSTGTLVDGYFKVWGIV